MGGSGRVPAWQQPRWRRDLRRRGATTSAATSTPPPRSSSGCCRISALRWPTPTSTRGLPPRHRRTARAVGFYQGADEIVTTAAIDRLIAGPGAILCGGRDGAVRPSIPLAQGPAQFQLGLGRILALEPVPMPAALRPCHGWWLRTGAERHADDRFRRHRVRRRPRQVCWRRRVARCAAKAPTSPRTWPASGNATAVALRRRGRCAGAGGAVAGVLRGRARCMFRVTTDRYLGQVEVGDLGRWHTRNTTWTAASVLSSSAHQEALAGPAADADRGDGAVGD